jgi:hypothetical protein
MRGSEDESGGMSCKSVASQRGHVLLKMEAEESTLLTAATSENKLRRLSEHRSKKLSE